MIQVEVVFAKPEHQLLKTLMVSSAATVEQAVLQSGFMEAENLHSFAFGVWNKVVELSHRLKEGDRVEIYRPLTVDPKTKRQLIIKKKVWRKPGLRA